MSRRLRGTAPYLIVLAITGFLYHVASGFQYAAQSDRIGPDAWPRAILALIAIVCVVRILAGLRLPLDRGPGGGVLRDVIGAAGSPPAPDDAPAEPEDKRYPVLLVAGIALTVAYVLLLGVLGFALDTVIYIAAMIRVGRYRNPRVIAAVAILGSLVFMFVFQKIVYLSLPIGIPPFASVSLALMQLMGIR